MSAIDIKEYTTKAVELESAIYTQKKLMDEHQELMRRQRPASPKQPNLQQPVKPTQPTEVYSKSVYVLMLIISIPIFATCIVLINALPLFGFIVLAACGFGICSLIAGQIQDNSAAIEAQEKYERDMAEYNRQMEDYKKRYHIAKDNYSKLLQNWNISVDEYDRKSETIMKQHGDVLESLEMALQKHYECDIVFPKYRNMVAITSINEYLMSGRCYMLEGPSGAYNLYEMELRQNIIIGQLSSIISSLEKIRDNQFSLYQELVKANETVNAILRGVEGVKENTKLTAYFAGITALIEASPKVYVGHSF